MASKWETKRTDANLPLMSQVLGVSETTARCLANRGLRTKNSALAFIRPDARRLCDIACMPDAQKALDRIAAAIEKKERIIVFGDYDVDGITSTVILSKVLGRLGADCGYHMPHRMREGYGMSAGAIRKIAGEGAGLVVAVDNGVSALDEIALANELGLDVIVVDHHEPRFDFGDGGRRDILPPAYAMLDPKTADNCYPFKEICAAGLSYKLAEALCRRMGADFREKDELLTLAAIATICDIVPLLGENRVLVQLGMKIFNENKFVNPGLGSLLENRGYLDRTLDTFSVGFVVGPCLNATGRLETASLAVELMMADDPKTRGELAEELARLNGERRSLTQTCVDRLMAALPEELPKVLVLTDTDAHESVAGIAAGRVKDATGRPTILLTLGDGAMKGSGRSIEKYNIFEAMLAHRHLFVKFGGHAMACGLTMPESNVEALREGLNADCGLSEEDFLPVTRLECELGLAEISLGLAEELALLAPYGKGNDEPVFASFGLYAETVRVLNEKNTLIFSFSQGGARVKGVAFCKNELYEKLAHEAGVNKHGGFLMDAAYTIETNEWQGARSAQLKLRDFRIMPGARR